MGLKTLELTLISAKDLKNVSMIGKMDVYVVVSISGDPNSKQKTPTHQDGGVNPSWNHTLRFTIDEATATYSGWEVVCVLKHDAFGPDKDLGEVRIPFKDLVAGYQGKSDAEFLTYQVKSKSSGKAKGELKISYRLKDASAADAHKGAPFAHAAPYAAPGSGAPAAYAAPYAAPGSSAPAYPYPPPAQQGAPYAYPGAAPGYPQYPPQGAYPQYPPQQQPGYGYGYPPQQGGYPVQQAAPKRGGGSGLGMGLGVGLLGGAVGGLLLGEMVEDSFDGGDCDF